MIGLKQSSPRPADFACDPARERGGQRYLTKFRVLSAIRFRQVCANCGGSL
jgi:hypothetical protein